MNNLEGDLWVNGNITGKSMSVPTSAVTDNSVAPFANVSASKLQQQIEETAVLADFATSAAAKRVQIHRVYGATATIQIFGVEASTANIGAATVVLDLLRNGTSVLSAQITLDSTTAAYALKQPVGFVSTSLVQGDVLEAQIVSATAGGGTLAKGVAAHLVLRAQAQ